MLARERDRFLAVARLRDDLVAGALEQRPQVESDDRLVFGYEDSDAGRLPRIRPALELHYRSAFSMSSC